jgi:D-lactate dehydrogenase (cytochrome)
MQKNITTKLITLVGKDHVSTKKSDLMKHSKGWSFHAALCPDVDVWPKNTKEVSEILKLANKLVNYL